MKSLYGLAALVFVSSLAFSNAYGHGLGGETHPAVTIGSRNATLSIDISPSTFDPEDPEKYITLRLFDSKTEAVIEHVTFILELKSKGELIFRQMFHDDLGNLNIKTVSEESGEISIDGQEAHGLGGWMRTPTTPVTMRGPVFTEGGLYEYKVEVLTVDSDLNVLDEPIELEGAISLADIQTFDVKDRNDNKYSVKTISYFDILKEFSFESNRMMFSMPFDWNQDIGQVSVVHEEIRIPNNFTDFLSATYDLTVNNVPVPGDVITIDDYSVDGRTVHLVLNKELLKQIRQKAILESDTKMVFILNPGDGVNLPLQAITPDYRYEIFLSWDPEIIRVGEDTKFYVDIRGMFTEKDPTEPIEYDLKLIQNDIEFYSKHVMGGVNSNVPDEHEFHFDGEYLGGVNLSLSNIGGNSLAKTNFILVVYPEDNSPDFPLTFRSMYESNGEKIEGSFDVDVTWIPAPIEQGESEFILTFYQKDTKVPITNAEYDFVLIKNGVEIFKKDGFAKAGGTFENYFFVENEVGDITVRIGNIAGTQEFIEIPIVVTPEFPAVFLILITPMAVLILFGKLKFSKIMI